MEIKNKEDLEKVINENIEITKELIDVDKNILDNYNSLLKNNNEDKKNIYLSEINTNDKVKRNIQIICLDKDYEKELYDMINQKAKLDEEITKRKEEIKAFIEENSLGSFNTDLLNIKYVSSTTTTTIDTTKLKKEMPEIAAQYSKVSPRSSSISISPLDK